MAEAEAARRAPPLERGAETDASAGGEHRKHTDAAKLTSLVPLSRRAAFFAESEAELAACKALARFDQASPARPEACFGRERTRRRTEASARPALKTRVRQELFEKRAR